MLPMIDNTILGAKVTGARILLPGTIYNYGSDAFPLLKEDSPQSATTHKGRLRIDLEQRLQDASHDGVRSLIIRYGDFMMQGPATAGSHKL